MKNHYPPIWQFEDGEFVFWRVKFLINDAGLLRLKKRTPVVRLSLGKSIIIAIKEKGINGASLVGSANCDEINRWRHRYPDKFVVKAPYRLNRAMCKRCLDIIESFHTHDFKWCKCGFIAVDGGYDYFKRTGRVDMIAELP